METSVSSSSRPLVVGIDLGAMYTRVAAFDPNSHRADLILEIPSLLGYKANEGWLIGELAKAYMYEYPGSVIWAHDLMFGYKTLCRNLPEGKQIFQCHDMLITYLKKLRALIEETCQSSCLAGAICIPGDLPPAHREEFRNCCREVWTPEEYPSGKEIHLGSTGLFIVASYYWETNHSLEEPLTEDEKVIFCDIGYRTSDISVIEYNADTSSCFEYSYNGVPSFTGKQLQNCIMNKMYQKYSFLIQPWPQKDTYMQLLAYAIDDALASYPDASSLRICLPHSEDSAAPKETEAVFSEEELHPLFAHEGENLAWELVKEAASGQMKMSDISNIILTGQMSFFPVLSKILSEILEKPVECQENPGHTAVTGAATYAFYNLGFSGEHIAYLDLCDYLSGFTLTEPAAYLMSDSLGRVYRFSPQDWGAFSRRVHIVVPESLEHWDCKVTSGMNPRPADNPQLAKIDLEKEHLQRLHYQFDAVLKKNDLGKLSFSIEPLRATPY